MTPVDFPNIRNITISGRIASGTTTLANNLIKTLGWELLEGGELFGKFHEEHLDDKSELAVSRRPDEVDLEYEEMIKKILKEKNHQIIQSHLAGFDAQGIPGVFKILVTCEDANGEDRIDIRIDRLVNRKGLHVDDAKHEIREREKSNLEKWRRMYAGEDPNWVYWDPKYYDLIVNTYDHNPEESLNLVLEKIGFNK
ncbi:MAG: cytidylate kinase family protein [Candidatus Levybacteria bacterium]|nr:cytidylate kinase family protein [Candidatus Levybacteria bacterium]